MIEADLIHLIETTAGVEGMIGDRAARAFKTGAGYKMEAWWVGLPDPGSENNYHTHSVFELIREMRKEIPLSYWTEID